MDPQLFPLTKKKVSQNCNTYAHFIYECEQKKKRRPEKAEQIGIKEVYPCLRHLQSLRVVSRSG